jgi:hypothetical protein
MIEIRRVGAELRQFLDGIPLEDGVTLDLLLPGGRWLTGTFEQGQGRRFVFAVGGGWERTAASPTVATLMLPASAVLRWPHHR